MLRLPFNQNAEGPHGSPPKGVEFQCDLCLIKDKVKARAVCFMKHEGTLKPRCAIHSKDRTEKPKKYVDYEFGKRVLWHFFMESTLKVVMES